jgi:hypothetical protein
MFGLNSVNDYIDKIVTLAQEVDLTDPIDWGLLTIDEESAYRLIAMSVINELQISNENEFESKKDIMIATIVKLVVENFVLNLKLNQE